MNRAIHANAEPSWKAKTPDQVRVYVWEFPIRFSHWIMVASIVSLSITGYYMHAPYVTARGHQAYVMGWMRFTHIVSAYALTAAMLVRLVWFFRGNQWVRLGQYLPLNRKRLRGMFRVGEYYSFLKWTPVSYIGHNPLAGLSYFIVYAMIAVEILTGFTLFSFVSNSPTLRFLTGWLPQLINIQYLREIHFFIMFGLWMFFLQHVYTAILIAIQERNGLMDSIFSGFKYVPKDQLARELSETESADVAEHGTEEVSAPETVNR